MTRLISLAVLIACIVIIGTLFYKVMAGFLIPLFLAAVLVVVFSPLHRRILRAVGGSHSVAAGVTTLLITLIVLLPAALLATLAAIQGIGLVRNVNPTSVAVAINKARDHLNLQSTNIDEIREIDAAVDGIQRAVGSLPPEEIRDPLGALAGYERTIHDQLREMYSEYQFQLSKAVALDLEQYNELNRDPALQEAQAAAAAAALAAEREAVDRLKMLMVRRTADIDSAVVSDAAEQSAVGAEDGETGYTLPTDLLGREQLMQPDVVQAVRDFLLLLDAVTPHPEVPSDPANSADLVELQSRAVQLGAQWQIVRTRILGGTATGFLREFVNPSAEQVRDFAANSVATIRPRLLEWTGATGAFMLRLIIGTAIMVVSLFFFLYDGPSMIRSLMRLSPMDDRYEAELLGEFNRIVRAIVLALITSALVQGLTAGVGYWMAGLSSLIFLIIVTTLCALIPFVGPAIVWIPVCIYLAVYEERFLAAGLLAAWGIFAVGSIDNVAKTVVLHGQSSLHPLLALLSILGGVQALGPIGIVVGPLVVTLLQTLLSILQRELVTIDQGVPLDAARGSPVHRGVAPGFAAAGATPATVGRSRLAGMMDRFKTRAATVTVTRPDAAGDRPAKETTPALEPDLKAEVAPELDRGL